MYISLSLFLYLYIYIHVSLYVYKKYHIGSLLLVLCALDLAAVVPSCWCSVGWLWLGSRLGSAFWCNVRWPWPLVPTLVPSSWCSVRWLWLGSHIGSSFWYSAGWLWGLSFPHWFPHFGALSCPWFPVPARQLVRGSRRGFLLLVLCALALALGCRIGSLPLVLSRRRWVFFNLFQQETVVQSWLAIFSLSI